MPPVDLKSVRKVMGRPPRHWVGDGFHVYPVFHDFAFSEELSPWLMFDYGAPKDFPANSGRRGVGKHPHRGFETITIAFQGEVEHRDSVGNRDVIGPGDVQWMTAGRGIIHEEYHSTQFSKTGGTLEMVQLWLNLPAKHKMTPPKYQPILKDQIPCIPLTPADLAREDCTALQEGCEPACVKIIAGELNGTRGPAASFSPVELWDVELGELTKVPYELPIPEGHNTIIFVRRGRAMVMGSQKDHEVEAQGVALLNLEGSMVRLQALEPHTQVLVLAGEPFDEPIAAMGPFVMNTRQELQQAQLDFRMGRMGS